MKSTMIYNKDIRKEIVDANKNEKANTGQQEEK